VCVFACAFHSLREIYNSVAGISRTYTPTEEDGEQFQPEHRAVQLKVPKELTRIRGELADFYNVIATQELGNMIATADIVISDRTILDSVPVPLLLFFEKQMTDLRTLVEKLPTLPTDKVWRHDEAKDDWVTEPETTVKTQKKVEVIVKYDATPEQYCAYPALDRNKPAYLSIYKST